MKVAIASDAIADLSGADASEVLARAFAARGAIVAVIALATTGEPLRRAVEEVAPRAQVVRPVDHGAALEALRGASGDLVLDLTDGALDARSVTHLSPGDLQGLRKEVVALVDEEQAQRPLTGLHGLSASRGRKARENLASVLAADARTESWAAVHGLPQGPGAGAAGGLGAVVQAMGGRVTDPLTYLAERFRLSDTCEQADLVVTGAPSLDFHAVGGPLLQRVVRLAGAALCPVIAVVGHNFLSSRELRLSGLEDAYPVVSAAEQPTSERLGMVAEQVARTWIPAVRV